MVWDVDVLCEPVLHLYRIEGPDTPTVYPDGDVTETEPTLPKWTMLIDELLP